MNTDAGRVPDGTGLSSAIEPCGLAPAGFDPSRDDDYDEHDCANCGGEGFTYGCSWDWQCDTYDEGEGTCLCVRSCDWCHPRQPDPALRAVLAEALVRDRDASLAEDAQRLSPEGVATRAEGIAQGPVS